MTELIDSLVRVLRAGPPLRLAVMFGSVAANRAHAASDLDIAITPRDPDLALHDELALVAQLASAASREVDLVRLDRATPVLRWQVARTGVLLYADPIEEWTRFRAREASEHADLGDALERCTRLYLRRLARSAS